MESKDKKPEEVEEEQKVTSVSEPIEEKSPE